MVGKKVGAAVGVAVGSEVGVDEGTSVGAEVGAAVGLNNSGLLQVDDVFDESSGFKQGQWLPGNQYGILIPGDSDIAWTVRGNCVKR